MTDIKVLEYLKNSMKEELDEIAEKEIKAYCDRFREEMRTHKAEIITDIMSNVEFLTTQEKPFEIIFQINIRGVNDKL